MIDNPASLYYYIGRSSLNFLRSKYIKHNTYKTIDINLESKPVLTLLNTIYVYYLRALGNIYTQKASVQWSF